MFAFPISQASVLRKARVGSEYKIRVGGGDDSEEYTQLQFSSKKKKIVHTDYKPLANNLLSLYHSV